MSKSMGRIGIIFLLAWLPLAPIALADPILLSATPTSAAFSTGQTVNVDVTVSGLPAGVPPSVGAFDLSVGFDATRLMLLSVDFGPFLGDPLLFEALTGFDNSTPGVVEFAEVSLLSPAELDLLQPSAFKLATLAFVATANGGSTFPFIGDRRVDDAFGAKLQIPEPNAIALLAAALCAAAALRARRRRTS